MTARNGAVEDLSSRRERRHRRPRAGRLELGLLRGARPVRRGRPGGRRARAAQIAAASATVPGPAVDLVPDRGAGEASWASPCEIDPLAVPLSDKGDLLVRATAAARDAGADLAEGIYQVWDTQQVVRLQRGPPHRPAHPRVRRRHLGQRDRRRRDPAPVLPVATAGSTAPAAGSWSTSWTWPRTPPRIAEEARALLTAPLCPAGETTLILGGEQMALQIHESVGHAIELDRILGWEAAFAGTSWLDLDQLGIAAVRLGADEHHHRPDHPGRAGLLRLRRRGHAGGQRARGPRRHLGRRARRPRLGGGGRAGLRRQRAGRRLGPAADGADDQRRPGARPAHPRRDHREPPTTACSWTSTGPGRSTTSG